MIVSVSRRTDIPAFYSDWFFSRIQDGEVLVRNPYNRKQVSRVFLTPDYVDCFVFWTKDALSIIKKLDLLKNYNYYFHFTVTPYGNDVEKNVRQKKDVIATFVELSKIIGSEKIIWRYDPILINHKYTRAFHIEAFSEMAQALSGCTKKCIISFIDQYKETKKNANELALCELSYDEMLDMAKILSEIAKSFNMEMESCAEKNDLSSVGVGKSQCIDSKLISTITGKDFNNKKRDSIRENCNCLKSVDMGEYNTCLHNCTYCYANYNSSTIKNNFSAHIKNSKLQIGTLTGDEKITDHALMKKL